MLRKFIQKHWYISLPLLWLYCFPEGIAWAHGDIAVIILYGRYCFIVGIVTACVFSALSRRHPIISSIAGMFIGILLGTLTLLLWAGDFNLFWDDLRLFLTKGLLIYSVPATLIGLAIGLLFKRLKKKG